MERYEFIHYRSFQKVNKNTFWVKAPYMNMEDPTEMKQKGLFRGHPKLSKKSNNTLIGLKLREICIVKVGQFLKKIHEANIDQTWIFFQMGLSFQD